MGNDDIAPGLVFWTGSETACNVHFVSFLKEVMTRDRSQAPQGLPRRSMAGILMTFLLSSLLGLHSTGVRLHLLGICNRLIVFPHASSTTLNVYIQRLHPQKPQPSQSYYLSAMISIHGLSQLIGTTTMQFSSLHFTSLHLFYWCNLVHRWMQMPRNMVLWCTGQVKKT